MPLICKGKHLDFAAIVTDVTCLIPNVPPPTGERLEREYRLVAEHLFPLLAKALELRRFFPHKIVSPLRIISINHGIFCEELLILSVLLGHRFTYHGIITPTHFQVASKLYNNIDGVQFVQRKDAADPLGVVRACSYDIIIWRHPSYLLDNPPFASNIRIIQDIMPSLISNNGAILFVSCYLQQELDAFLKLFEAVPNLRILHSDFIKSLKGPQRVVNNAGETDGHGYYAFIHRKTGNGVVS